MNNKLLSAGVTALLLASAASVQAQTRARPAAAPATPARTLAEGPAIPGLCVFFLERGIGQSTVGQAFESRMQQLQSQAAAEIGGEQTALANDEKAFQARRASLTQEQFAQQAQPFQQRESALSQKAQLRQAELEYTYRHQLSRIEQAVNPIIQSAYQERRCSILIEGDGNNVIAANSAMDLTPTVTQQLNSRMSTITFDRETPPPRVAR